MPSRSTASPRLAAAARRLRLAAAVVAAALPAAAAPAGAQDSGRWELAGERVAVFNLVGTVRVARGDGDATVVEVTARGSDAARLRVEVGEVDGRTALRVVFPGTRVRFAATGIRSLTTMSVRADGTFGGGWAGEGSDDGHGRLGVGHGAARQVTIAGSGEGLDAWAEVVVRLPRGRRLAARLGAGALTADGVEGALDVDVSAASVAVRGMRGRLDLDTGSGEVRVTDAEGDLRIDSGSGGVRLDGVRADVLHVDGGSGAVRARDVRARSVTLDLGSGGADLAGLDAEEVTLDSGSGSVELGLAGRPRSLRVDSSSGSVTLRLPVGYGAAVTIDAGSGGYEVELPVRVRRQSRSRLEGEIGDGAGSLSVDAGSGTVRILAAGPGAG